MNNRPTTKEPETAGRDGEAAAASAYPGPLARFVDSVGAMRESLEGEALAHGVAGALETLTPPRVFCFAPPCAPGALPSRRVLPRFAE